MICVVDDELIAAHSTLGVTFKFAARYLDCTVEDGHASRRFWPLSAEGMGAVKAFWKPVSVAVYAFKWAHFPKSDFAEDESADSP